MSLLPWVLLALSMVASIIGALLLEARSRRILAEALKNIPQTRMARIEIEVAELRELNGALLESHKKLRSRTDMRNLRNQRGEEPPDWRTDPEGYRLAMEKKHGLITTTKRETRQ